MSLLNDNIRSNSMTDNEKVSLVTTVEQKIEEDFGMTVTLLDDIAGLEHKNPFLTVKTLSDYVTSVLETKRFE
jgi:hypothetical protein